MTDKLQPICFKFLFFCLFSYNIIGLMKIFDIKFEFKKRKIYQELEPKIELCNFIKYF